MKTRYILYVHGEEPDERYVFCSTSSREMLHMCLNKAIFVGYNTLSIKVETE
ncbi:hypothetical protein KAX97_09960 [candidate division WOR-3 bacterium]|nr:hypothetical protein [candidate division WOR-3 bacterium]